MGKISIGTASLILTANIGLLASAIPAVVGRGAPYLPTLEKNRDIIFNEALPRKIRQNKTATRPTLVDLGSGDGRVVIDAARRGYNAIGYEFNPLLVMVSRLWAFIDARRGRWGGKTTLWADGGNTTFHCRDIWNVPLNNIGEEKRPPDVIFVYGLGPIMETLGEKIGKEAPEAIVVSHVFQLDANKWNLIFKKGEVHLYEKKR